MNSLQHGALREFPDKAALLDAGLSKVSNFFAAVQHVFRADWEGHARSRPPRSRRGALAMGYVMDEVAIRFAATTREQFEDGLRPLLGRTHWTSGEWEFGDERRPWNSLQNTKSDYRLLAHHLVRMIRRGRARVGAAA